MTTRSKFHLHCVTQWLAVVVAWGAWNAYTDCYPLGLQQARPSWYEYGWPVCFATSSRGMFNFVSFDTTALAFDLAISLAMVAATVYAGEALVRRFPQLTMADMFAVVTGFAVMSFAWSGGMSWACERIMGALPPPPEMAASAGNLQPTHRVSALIVLPASLGLASIGFVVFRLPFDILSHKWTRNKGMHGSGGLRAF